MRLDTFLTYAKRYPDVIKQDLVFIANSSNLLDTYFYDDNDALVDITGATVIFIVKSKPSDANSSAVINKSITTFTAAQNGNTLIEVTQSECASLLGNYVYELRIELADSGYDYILKQGNLTFQKSLYATS